MEEKTNELIYLLNLWSMRGSMGDKELIELFKIFCSYQEYFEIPEPKQEGTNYIYNITWKDKFKEDLLNLLK